MFTPQLEAPAHEALARSLRTMFTPHLEAPAHEALALTLNDWEALPEIGCPVFLFNQRLHFCQKGFLSGPGLCNHIIFVRHVRLVCAEPKREDLWMRHARNRLSAFDVWGLGWGWEWGWGWGGGPWVLLELGA